MFMKKILNGFGLIAIIILIAIILFGNSAHAQTQVDSLKVKKSLSINGVSVKRISTDTNFVSNADTVIATQKAVKNYVDRKVGSVDLSSTLNKANNLADVTNINTARTNLQTS